MVLKPWRKIAIPHGDVAAGRYKQTEFAADLAQVIKGDASPEYQDAVEFFRRTYITDGLRRLLKTALERLTKGSGEPVVKLKTSFGGGKTHSMLALYHLFGGTAPSRLQGIKQLMKDTEVQILPRVRIAVLVGTALDASKPHKHPDLIGHEVSTLWGELAVQIGGSESANEAYELVRAADEKGVAPGSDTLVQLFDAYGPCLILIDELVAYARNIYHRRDLPAGTFDSNMTFVHNLTEAVKRSKSSIVVASIPASDIEIGGEGGAEALARIENTFGRLEAIWQPVGQLESFEIVRRRLFNKITSEVDRDTTCSEFHKMYREQSADFPTRCREGEYLVRLKNAYPIHPEFFDRLYEDWATLERFQRTRGVLRLMAAVVHELWSKNDTGSLIMPGDLPLYSAKVRDELTRYLGEQWSIVVDTDIDGGQSGPYIIDKDFPRIGSISAARRVARTMFLGSAPSVRQQNVRGIEDVRIRLGVARPDDNLATYADALTRLTDRLTYLYHDNRRYWYDLRPNLRRTVEDRAVQWDAVEVEQELVRRLQHLHGQHSYARIHVTSEPAEVPDDQEVRLVVLRPGDVHRNGLTFPAQDRAKLILDSTGAGPRLYKNMLMFLAPDGQNVQACLQEIRRNLAWNSVVNDEEKLGLDKVQLRQAQTESDRTNKTISSRIAETYSWIIVPYQEVIPDKGISDIKWDTSHLPSGPDDSVFARASAKVLKDQQLISQWSPLLLKKELDALLWKERSHIEVKQLWEYMASYLYLPRLANKNVLVTTIQEGVRTGDFFAYAAGMDDKGKYLGLSYRASGVRVLLDGTSLLVKPEIVQSQLTSVGGAYEVNNGHIEGVDKSTDATKSVETSQVGEEVIYRRFHGSVTLDPVRVGRDAGKIAEEVITHLSAIKGASVNVTIEIEADLPNGAPKKVVQTITENAQTLKFKNCDFEKS